MSDKSKLDDFFAKKDAKKKTFKFKSSSLNLNSNVQPEEEVAVEQEAVPETNLAPSVVVKKFEKRVAGVFDKKEDDGWVEEDELRQPIIQTGGRQVEEMRHDEPEEEAQFDENPQPMGKTWDMEAVEVVEDKPAPAPQSSEKSMTSLEMLMDRRYGGARKETFKMSDAQFPTLGGKGDKSGVNPTTGVKSAKPATVHMNIFSTLTTEKRGSWAERMEDDDA